MEIRSNWVLRSLSAALLCGYTALAQTPRTVAVRYLAPEEMARNATAVALVEITGVGPTLVQTAVYTDYRCRILEVWAGDLQADSILVRQPGGTAEGRTTYAGPLPAANVGDRWVFSLAATAQGWWTIYGISQGAFHVQGNMAVRDYSGYSLTSPPPASVSGNVEQISAEELKERMIRVQTQTEPREQLSSPRSPSPAPPSPAATSTEEDDRPGMAVPKHEDTLAARNHGADAESKPVDELTTRERVERSVYGVIYFVLAVIGISALLRIWRRGKRDN